MAATLELGAVLVLTLLAFLLRFKALGKEGLWFDEADLVTHARADWGTLLGNFTQPGQTSPLYSLFLHLIYGGASQPMPSETVVRLPAMVFGVLCVPMIYLLGRRLWSGAVGLGAAVLLTVSSYHIWYAQDAKMYTLICLLMLVTTYALVAALQTGRRGWWVLFCVVTVAGFYTQPFALLVLGAQVIYLLWARRGRGISRRVWLAAAAVALPIAVLSGVWIVRGLIDGTFGKGWYDTVSPFDMLGILATRFAVNRSLTQIEQVGALLFALLAACGLWAAWREAPTPSPSPTNEGGEPNSYSLPSASWGKGGGWGLSPFALLSLWLGFPVVVFYLFQLYIPVFSDRYLLVISPAYYLLAAGGIVWLARRLATLPVAVVALAAVLGLTALALNGMRYSPIAQKEEWKSALQYVAQHARPNDVILVFPGYLRAPVDYYWRPDGILKDQVRVIDDLAANDAVVGKDDGQTLTLRMNALLPADTERVWFVTSPERYKREEPTQYLRDAYFRFNTFQFDSPFRGNGVEVIGYEVQRNITPYTGQTRIIYDNALSLDGFDYSLPGDGTYKQSDYLRLTFYWHALSESISKNQYAMRVRLLDSANNEVKIGNDPYQDPAVPVLRGFLPQDKQLIPRWPKPERQVRDYRDIYVRPDLPPGQYRIELTVYKGDAAHPNLNYPNGKPELALPPSIAAPGNAKGASSLSADGKSLIFSLPFNVTT